MAHKSTDLAPYGTAPRAVAKRATQKLLGALKIALAVGLLLWLARSGRLDARAFATLDARALPWLALAALLQCAMIATMGARWRAWLQLFPLRPEARPQSATPADGSASERAVLSWREALVVAARGACAGAWTPAGLGLDGIRAAHALRRFQLEGRASAPGEEHLEEPPATQAPLATRLWRLLQGSGAGSGIVRAVALASLLDRLVAMAALGLLCLPFLAARLLPQHKSVAAPVALVGLLALWAAGAALLRRVDGTSSRGAVGAAAWALGTHAANVAAMGAALQALAPQLGVARAMALACEVGPVVILSSALPLTPLGLGVADATGEALLAQHGLGCGGEWVMLARATWLGVCLLAGLAFWLPDTPRTKRQRM